VTARRVVVFAGAKLLFHVLTNGQYGFHRDELATLADARHLDWGYVAYPPLTPFVGRMALELFGDSLTGFRCFAALAQSVAIVLAGALARLFGGPPAAQLLAAVAVAVAPVSLSASHLLQYVSFDYLGFVALTYLVARLVDSGDERCWLAIGATIGAAVLTKYTAAFFAVGLLTAVLLTPLRAQLTRHWPWLGAFISLLIASPNLLWQARHDFISLDFLRAIHERDVRIGRTDGFLGDQLWVTTNAVTLPLWGLGLFVLLFAARGRRFRVLGLMAVVPFALLLVARGRGYYMGPVYPVLLAAGAADLDRILKNRPGSLHRLAYSAAALVLALGSGIAVVVLPLARPGSALFGWVVTKNDDLAEELGWPELASEVARIYRTLPAEERERTGVFCGNYGEAGAVDLYGPALGLPPAISGTNSYWLRGPGDPAPETLILLGASREQAEGLCGSMELVGHTGNRWGVRNEESEHHPDIFVCRALREPLPRRWPSMRRFG
jgi:hypothetical protein